MSVSKFKDAQEVYDMGHFAAAITYAKEALKADKKNWQILNFIGSAFANLGEYDECVKYCKRALKISPRNAHVLSNTAVAYQEKGQHERAIQYFNQAVAIEPETPVFKHNLAHLNFLLGDFEEFVKNYPYRHFVDKSFVTTQEPLLGFSQEQRFEGKSILVYQEQGLGDEIFFIRLLPEFLRNHPSELSVICDPRLKKICSRSFDNIKFYSSVEDIHEDNEIECKIPMGDLLLFSKHDNSRVTCPPWQPDKAKFDAWKNRLSSLRKQYPAIGISWSGGRHLRSKKKRSISLPDLIMSLPTNVHLVNVQYDYDPNEIRDAEIKCERKIWNWDFFDPKYDIENLAGLVANLDAVVSVDNTTVHLAGALGVSTIVLLPVDPDFRWGLSNETSPFYPSVSCIRQKSFDSWDVLEEIDITLHRLLKF